MNSNSSSVTNKLKIKNGTPLHCFIELRSISFMCELKAVLKFKGQVILNASILSTVFDSTALLESSYCLAKVTQVWHMRSTVLKLGHKGDVLFYVLSEK